MRAGHAQPAPGAVHSEGPLPNQPNRLSVGPQPRAIVSRSVSITSGWKRNRADRPTYAPGGHLPYVWVRLHVCAGTERVTINTPDAGGPGMAARNVPR